MEILSFAILAPVSLISQLILLYGYLKIKKFRQHPDTMIFWHCVSESVLDISWITGLTKINQYLTGNSCQVVGAIIAYFLLLNWNYMTFLSLEIMIKVKDPLNSNYKQRVKAYHVFSNISSLALFICLLSANNNNGKSGLSTCLVENRSVYSLLVLVPSFIHLPIMMLACFYILWASRKLKHATYAKHHIYVVAMFLITRIPVSLADGLQYNGFHVRDIKALDSVSIMQMAVVLGTASGFLVVLARMSQKGAPRKIFHLLFRWKIGNKQTMQSPKLILIRKSEHEKIIPLYLSSEFDDITCEVRSIQAIVDNLLALYEYFKTCISDGVM